MGENEESEFKNSISQLHHNESLLSTNESKGILANTRSAGGDASWGKMLSYCIYTSQESSKDLRHDL